MFGNNGGGNPNHASDGKFTSGANQAGNKVEGKENYESQIKEKLGIKNDANPSYEEKMQSAFGMKNPQPMEKPKKKWTIGTNNGQLLGDEEIIEADTEEEAFKIAEDRYPGYADELSVNPVENNNAGMPEDDKFSKARKQLDQYGEAIVGEEGDRVFSVSTDGEKFYGFSYRTNYDGPIEGTEEEYDDGYNSLEEAVAAMEKDGYPIYDEFKGEKAKDSKFIVNKRNPDYRHTVSADKSVSDEEWDTYESEDEWRKANPDYEDQWEEDDYSQKIQSQMGISNPESPKEDEKQKLWNSFSEEMKSSYNNDFEKFSKEYDEVKEAPEKDLEEKNKHRQNLLSIKNAKSMSELNALKDSLLTKKLNGEINDEQWNQIATAYSNAKDILGGN